MIIQPQDEIRITTGSQVALHFSVSLENGHEIDNTRQRDEPVQLVIGDGSLLPGFEQALMGLRAGDRRTVHLPPTEAFGEWNPENIQYFDTIKFGDRPQIGQIMEFEDKSKSSLFGVVKSVNAQQVEVDFNHPLAGQSISFEVEIFRVTPAGQQGIALR